jgi:hypothetical protein
MTSGIGTVLVLAEREDRVFHGRSGVRPVSSISRLVVGATHLAR